MLSLKMGDWLYNAGLVGFYNILENHYDPLNVTKMCEITPHGLTIKDEAVFENFGEKYFAYFGKHYTNFMPYGKIVASEQELEKWLREGLDEEALKKLNKNIEYVKTKLKSNSYLSAYKTVAEGSRLEEEGKKLSKINLKKNQAISDADLLIKEQIRLLLKIISLMTTEETADALLAKEFTYNYTNNFLKDVSVWGTAGAKGHSYAVYNEYFLPKLAEFLQADPQKAKDTCICCGCPLAKSKHGFDLTWLVATGVDSARKPSHYWNFNSDTVVCPVCNIIYSCVPAGFKFLNNQGFFINYNFNMRDLFSVNKVAPETLQAESVSISKLEVYSYFRVANILKSESLAEIGREIENIQVVKINAQNERRPYSFNLLDKQLAYIIFLSQEPLQTLAEKNIYVKSPDGAYYNLFTETINRLFLNQNLYSLLHLCLVSNSSLFGMGQIFAVQKNIMKIKGGKHMDKQFDIGKQIEYAKFCGLELQEIYEKKSLGKKVDTLTYKALNALKTKNSSTFADILLNAYMTVEKPIPTIFVSTLKNEELLQALGYAFVLGLKGQGKSKNEKDETAKVGGEN